jgi:hypothetical protein
VLAYEMFNRMALHLTHEVRRVRERIRRKLSKRTTKAYCAGRKIKQQDRVNLQKLSTNDNAEPNITGGYIFKKITRA